MRVLLTNSDGLNAPHHAVADVKRVRFCHIIGNWCADVVWGEGVEQDDGDYQLSRFVPMDKGEFVPK